MAPRLVDSNKKGSELSDINPEGRDLSPLCFYNFPNFADFTSPKIAAIASSKKSPSAKADRGRLSAVPRRHPELETHRVTHSSKQASLFSGQHSVVLTQVCSSRASSLVSYVLPLFSVRIAALTACRNTAFFGPWIIVNSLLVTVDSLLVTFL